VIPQVRRPLRALTSLTLNAEPVEQRLEQIRPAMRANGSAAVASALEQELSGIYEQMGQIVDGLVARGIVLRDGRNGIVDFPCRYRGRVIMLCWQMDEPDLDFWHEADAGFLTRQPLNQLPPDDEGQ